MHFAYLISAGFLLYFMFFFDFFDKKLQNNLQIQKIYLYLCIELIKNKQ